MNVAQYLLLFAVNRQYHSQVKPKNQVMSQIMLQHDTKYK